MIIGADAEAMVIIQDKAIKKAIKVLQFQGSMCPYDVDADACTEGYACDIGKMGADCWLNYLYKEDDTWNE